MMVVVTALKFTLNFSRVRDAKDPSLANLPSQRLQETFFPTCINSLYNTKSFSPESEYNAHTQAL